MLERTFLEDYFDKPVEPPRRWTPEQVEALKAQEKYEKQQTQLSKKGNKSEGVIAMERAKQHTFEYARMVEQGKAHTLVASAQSKANTTMEKLAASHSKALKDTQDANDRARQQVGQYQQQARNSLFSFLGF